MYLGQQVIGRHQRWMHPRIHSAVGTPADGKQFDAVAELPGKLDVQRTDRADAFGVDGACRYPAAECQADQNRQFVHRVDAVDIK